jgi:hypothetical protein
LPIVARALSRIGQHLARVVEKTKLVAPVVALGKPVQGLAPQFERALDVFGGGVACDPEDFVERLLGQLTPLPFKGNRRAAG